MMNVLKKAALLFGVLTLAGTTSAQETDRIHYTGSELSNPNMHDGALSPVVGVHNIQTMRAMNERPIVARSRTATSSARPNQPIRVGAATGRIKPIATA